MNKFISLFICFLVLISPAYGQISDQSFSNQQPKQTNTSPFVDKIPLSTQAKDVAQILFWLVVSVVSVMTYLGAKKTILQPIRTEIFKVQLKEMSAILSMFVGKGEIELRRAFVFDKLLFVNTAVMYDAYAANFFDIKVESDKRPYNHSECPISFITEEGMTKHFKLADDHLREDVSASKEEKKDPRVRAALWVDYKQYSLAIPREFTEQEKKIQEMLENPLLPTECVKLLNEYLASVHGNLNLVRNILTECAKEMPEKYPSLEKLNNSSFNWIEAQYNDKFSQLKPKADAIITFVRSRYDVDNLQNI